MQGLCVGWPELFWKHPGWSGQRRLEVAYSKHNSGGEEAILEDGGVGLYWAEALIMPSVGPSIDKGRIWFYINKVVDYPKEHGCSGVDAPLLEGVPFEVSLHIGDAACSGVVMFHESCSSMLDHF